MTSTRQFFLLSRPKHSIRIAVLDDHPIINLGTAAYLRGHSDFDVVLETTASDQFFATLEKQPCDVVVVDFYMPLDQLDGTHLIKRLRTKFPKLSIITFSAGKALETEYAAYRAGANAFMQKSSSLPLLADAIRMVTSQPKSFFSVRNEKLLSVVPTDANDTLSNAETEVLRLISEGYSVTQIAQKMCRSKKTISTHKRRSMTKLSLADDLSLALFLKEKFRH
jgi:two-component system, NarL family, captular synthesis response regulator RcsB